MARQRLRAWFRANARDLPWRQTRDPYAIWISEIMLQQTQVATVLRYFPRFLAKFPDVQSLAASDERAVLRLWEGLGYYRRARQLHAAAKSIVENHAGQFPRQISAVRLLPGIGRYTAGAILSIAFDAPHPILEANTIRLLSRLWAYRGKTHTSAGQTLLWKAAASLLATHGNREINQALMELGSLICTPRNPKCCRCPLESLCAARKHGLEDRIPISGRKESYQAISEAAVVVRKNGSVLLRQCLAKERWAGLWDFPRFRLNVNGAAPHRKEKPSVVQFNRQVIAGVQKLVGIPIERPKHFATLRHSVTYHRITLYGFSAQCGRAAKEPDSLTYRWVRPEQFDEYPFNVTGRKLAELWRKHHGM